MKLPVATLFALFALAAVAAVAVPSVAADVPPAAAAAPPAKDQAKDQGTLEKEFADLLTGATLAGSFTAGAKGGQPREDRYTILKAVKGKGEDWVITAKIEYKGIGLPIDLTVPVKWAGDTPVISVTDYKIPGFGTFTARVMFYAGQYAGTWDAGDHGGLMWGRVEKAGKADKRDAPATRPVQ